jgi:hypothetical protein
MSGKVVVLTGEPGGLFQDEKRRLIDLHESITNHMAGAVADAIASGEMLTKIRATFPKRAPKGEGFGDWVEQNLPYPKYYAYGYIRAYENREHWLANPHAPVRQIMGISAGKSSNADSPEETPVDELTPVLTASQERRAQSIAKGVGCSINKARAYVLSTVRKAPTKKAPDAEPSSVVKRTVRYDPEIDDMILTVAQRTGRSYSVVANELSTIGKTRYRTRYAEYLTPGGV